MPLRCSPFVYSAGVLGAPVAGPANGAQAFARFQLQDARAQEYQLAARSRVVVLDVPFRCFTGKIGLAGNVSDIGLCSQVIGASRILIADSPDCLLKILNTRIVDGAFFILARTMLLQVSASD